MTNKEKYQRAFSVLHASGDCVMEVTAMNRTTRRYIPRLAAACMAAVLVLSTVAYAADIGDPGGRIHPWL